jgi:hypothetical protein
MAKNKNSEVDFCYACCSVPAAIRTLTHLSNSPNSLTDHLNANPYLLPPLPTRTCRAGSGRGAVLCSHARAVRNQGQLCPSTYALTVQYDVYVSLGDGACVCGCWCVRVRVCARACACVRVRVRARACVRACVRALSIMNGGYLDLSFSWFDVLFRFDFPPYLCVDRERTTFVSPDGCEHPPTPTLRDHH